MKDKSDNKTIDLVGERNWGGARKGAGRKSSGIPTKVKRIPEAYLPAVNALIEFLDEHRDLTAADGTVCSEEQFYRPLESAQRAFVTFQAEVKKS